MKELLKTTRPNLFNLPFTNPQKILLPIINLNNQKIADTYLLASSSLASRASSSVDTALAAAAAAASGPSAALACTSDSNSARASAATAASSRSPLCMLSSKGMAVFKHTTLITYSPSPDQHQSVSASRCRPLALPSPISASSAASLSVIKGSKLSLVNSGVETMLLPGSR